MLAEERQRPPLQFDLFELDPSNYQLRRRGVPVELPPQALRILILLAARPDELVTRKEIKEALWPGQSYGDFDSRLNFTVKKLREALGDDAERPRYVQTVRNAGYRFIMPVRQIPSSGGEASIDSSADEFVNRNSRSGPPFLFGVRRAYLATGALVLIAIGAVSTLALYRPRSSLVASEPVKGQLKQTAEDQPSITSMTPIIPAERQRIVIRGRGLGMHVPYAHTDSPYLAIRNETADWAAGPHGTAQLGRSNGRRRELE